MEIGPVGEITILTPDDVTWIRRALKERDQMAHTVLEQGQGRAVTCQGDGETPCPNAVTHYAHSAGSDGWAVYCAEHWKSQGDPWNLFGLDDRKKTPAGGAKEQAV